MAERSPSFPLDQTHLQELSRGLLAAEEGLRQIALAKQAGIDVAQQERDLLASRDKILAIKQTYFPNQ